MDEKIREKLDKLILKALESPTSASVERARILIDMRAEVDRIKNMEK